MDTEAELIAEQLRHTIDLLRAELDHLRQVQTHNKDLTDHRLKELEKARDDHETRLRSVTDGVTQFKMFSGLATGGSGFVSIIALIKSFIGG